MKSRQRLTPSSIRLCSVGKYVLEPKPTVRTNHAKWDCTRVELLDEKRAADIENLCRLGGSQLSGDRHDCYAVARTELLDHQDEKVVQTWRQQLLASVRSDEPGWACRRLVGQEATEAFEVGRSDGLWSEFQ
jgi:hypothetical protein